MRVSENPLRPKYRPDIDGLRAVAVLSVVFYHGFPGSLRGGFVGVDIFFMISGFLISTIIFQSIDQGSFSVSNFYSRRIRRIFPALAIVLISVLAFGWLCLFPDELQQLGKHTAASAGFIQNFILWREVGYFDNASETKPLLHIWSLGIEEQFYLIWPLLLWMASKLGKINDGHHEKLCCFLATISVFVLSFVLNLDLVKLDPAKTFYLPQYRFFELALGGMLSWWVLYGSGIWTTPVDKQKRAFLARFDERRIRNVSSITGFLILLIAFGQFNKQTVFPGKNALIPIFATAMIIWAGPQSWFNNKILSNKVLVWFGLISFPLYLWHWPIFAFGRIVYGGIPALEFRFIAVAISILLSWLTVRFIEGPFRFGNTRVPLKLATLGLVVCAVGGIGFTAGQMNFDDTHTYQKLAIKRKGFEFAVGSSLAWYKGKDDWLFLGDTYDKTVQKLVGAIVPTKAEIIAANEPLLNLAKTAKKFNTQIALLVAPNKSTIYGEYLPDEFVPSTTRYSHFFVDRLQKIPNLITFDPTNDLLKLKETEGFLYWQTDTHWNDKGSYLVYAAFLKHLSLPVPEVEFQQEGTHSGDLIEIAKLRNFPLHAEDNWTVVWKNEPKWTETEIPNQPATSFGKPTIVTNPEPLSDKKVWVVGDSFAHSLRKYFNATFREVRYIGHWYYELKDLPGRLNHASDKPDLIVVVRAERSF